jgi:hypothetical protein
MTVVEVGEVRLERTGKGRQLAGKLKEFGEEYRGRGPRVNIYSAQNYQPRF